MRKELEVAAKNTHWWYFGLRSLCHPKDFESENSIEFTIYRESLMCSAKVHDLVIRGLCNDYDLSLLNHSLEYILSKYSTEYPELCLILCHLRLFGPLSSAGVTDSFSDRTDYIFGFSSNSPLYLSNFYRKCVPIIRITPFIFTLGTDQPQFSAVSDVKRYYRDKARIKEITELCEFWIRKFYN